VKYFPRGIFSAEDYLSPAPQALPQEEVFSIFPPAPHALPQAAGFSVFSLEPQPVPQAVPVPAVAFLLQFTKLESAITQHHPFLYSEFCPCIYKYTPFFDIFKYALLGNYDKTRCVS
jgi:hypothetical protein